MKTGLGSWIAVALVIVGTLLGGCSSTGKKSSSSVAGIKSSDKSLRTAVEKDPFPRAPGMMAAGMSGTTKTK